jgi:hypothetical protein
MPSNKRPTFAWLAVVIVALAAGLRGFQIGAQPLRGDEAFSVRFASLPVAVMWEAFAVSEPNPPLQFFGLKLWMELAGRSELAVRWPSALAGVLGVALLYRFAWSLAGQRAALLSALALALSPFLVWYGRDVRIYSLLATLILAFAWALWLAARHNRAADWMAAGFLALLALMIHYFAALSLMAVGAAFLITDGRTRWRPALVTAFLATLAYLPWALYIAPLLSGHNKSWLAPVGPLEALWRTLVAYSVGGAFAGATPPVQALGAGLLAAVVIVGLWKAARADRTRALWLIALGPATPLALYALSLWRPVFSEHYASAGLPGTLLLAVAGAMALPRAGRWFGIAALAALNVLALGNLYFDPAFAKAPDWRALAAHLRTTARSQEVVLVNAPDPAFEYYFAGPQPFENAPPGPLAEVGEAAAVAQLERVRDSFQHARLLFQTNPAYDPDGFVSNWLMGCCELMGDEFVGKFRVQSFDTPAGSLAARRSLAVEFERSLHLTGYRFVNGERRAGDSLRLTLFWEAREPLAEAYTVFVHFVAPDGFYLVGADGVPRSGDRPTFTWTAGETIIDPRLIALPVDLTPGEYFVEVGWYAPDTGQRLLTTEGADRVRLPQAVVVR